MSVGGPMPSLVSGNSSSTAAQADARSSGGRLPALRDSSASGSAAWRRLRAAGSDRTSSPFTRATTASSARRGLIDLAMSRGVVPGGTCCVTAVRQGNCNAAHVISDIPAMEFLSFGYLGDSRSFSVSWEGERAGTQLTSLRSWNARAAGDAAALQRAGAAIRTQDLSVSLSTSRRTTRTPKTFCRRPFLRPTTHLDSLPGRFQVLYLDRADRRERSPDEAAQAEIRQDGLAGRAPGHRRRPGRTRNRGLGRQSRTEVFARGTAPTFWTRRWRV